MHHVAYLVPTRFDFARPPDMLEFRPPSMQSPNYTN